MSIKCINLISGEALIGEVNENLSSTQITITQPLRIVVSQRDANTMSIGLIPAYPFSDEKEFTFMKEHIILTYEPSIDLHNQYHEYTGRGIIKPEKTDLSLIK